MTLNKQQLFMMWDHLFPFKSHFPDFFKRPHIKAVSQLQNTSYYHNSLSVPRREFHSGDLTSYHYFHWHRTNVFMFPASPLYGLSGERWNTFNETVDDETLYTESVRKDKRLFLPWRQALTCQTLFRDSSPALSHNCAQSQPGPTLTLTFWIIVKRATR